MNLYFIINPAAKNGLCKKIWWKLEKTLQKQKVQYESYFTEARGDGSRITREILAKTDGPASIVAVGGDGTVHEVVNGVHPFRHGIIGYIPAGSGNDFSRGFSLPKKPAAAMKLILRNRTFSKTVDAGHFQIQNGKQGFFINNFGCGFDASVVKNVNESRLKVFLNKMGLGKLAYLFIMLRELFRFRPVKMLVEVDGQSHLFQEAWFATVSNHPFFGGGMKISPDSDPADGSLETVIIHDISRWKILFLFLTVFSGKHVQRKEVTLVKGKRIRIQTESAVAMHADGEYVGEGEVELTVVPQFLSVVAPFVPYGQKHHSAEQIAN